MSNSTVPPVPPAIPEIAPGYLTSEFYGHLFVTIFGVLMASGVIHVPAGENGDASPVGQIVGSVLALLSQGTYSFGRVALKSAGISAGLAAVNAFVAALGANNGNVTTQTYSPNPASKIGF